MDNLHKLADARFGNHGIASDSETAEIERRAQARREAGRYTLEEAAFFLERNAGARAESVLKGLIDAVHNNVLTIYEPGGIGKYKPDVVRGWNEEAYWDDLNDWLRINEQRIGPIFPFPADIKKAISYKLTADLDELDARDERRAEIRRKAGRYNLEEATEMIAKGAGEVYEQILGKLERAAENHTLTTYMFGRNSHEEYGSERGQCREVNAYFHECSWEDLNKWLKENEPRINYEFPNPADTPTSAKVVTVKGIDKRKVMAAFQGIKWSHDQWGRNLASPSLKLKDCRTSKGSKKKSALWHPVDIALYLLDEKIPLNKLDPVFVHLNDWADEWREKTELERS